MSSFTGQQAQFTPATTADNWTLDGGTTVSAMGKVKMFNWGGSGTTSTGYRTRWARPSTGASGTFTAIAPQGSNPLPAAVCRFGTFATQATLGTDPGSNLFSQNWNVLGGGGVIVLPIGGEWFIIASATLANQQISCRNTAGVDANLSNYGLQWEE